MHYVISRARRDSLSRKLYEQGKLVCPGFSPMPVPEDLRILRDECGRGAQHSAYTHMSVVIVDGKAYPVIADESTMRVAFTEDARKRLRELRDANPGPPAAKRARVIAASADLQRFKSLDAMLSKFIIRNRQSLTVDGATVHVLRAEDKQDGSVVVHYLHNAGNERIVLKKNSHVATSSKVHFFDRNMPADLEALNQNPNLITYPYKWTAETWFVYRFGANSEVITQFGAMLAAAKAAHAGEVNTYGHNLADSAASGASSQRVVVPHASRRSDLAVQPEPLSDAQWSADLLVNFLTVASAGSSDSATLVPVYRVKLEDGGRRRKTHP